ncbi:unnamed protein product [Linum trigynum]|uniref:Uncharacterized protein n=1 Tax=Linum trigynum TaxID=586398 RepID=A0AAV2CS64_9ROSI
MPAAKFLKPSPESSPGMTLGSTVVSPSASPLVSPLAKIKVEKLDLPKVLRRNMVVPRRQVLIWKGMLWW